MQTVTNKQIREYVLSQGRRGLTNSKVVIKRNGEVHAFGPLRKEPRIDWHFVGSRADLAEKLELLRLDEVAADGASEDELDEARDALGLRSGKQLDEADVSVSVAREVLAERQRQIEAEGFGTEHDDEHIHAQLSKAAICYLNPLAEHMDDSPPEGWPWASRWWRPEKGRRANLLKAAALIVAEIERHDRRAAKASA